MIGNVAEWTAEWYAGVGDGSVMYFYLMAWPDPQLYGDDRTYNIQSGNSANARGRKSDDLI